MDSNMSSNVSLVRDVLAKYSIYLFVGYIIVVLSHEFFFNPLRHFPGPFIARFTNGYGAFYALKRTLHLKTRDDHLRYGPVIRQGPNKLVFNSSTALSQIYNNDRITKTVAYLSNQVTPGVYNVWSALDRDLHRQKRRLIGPAVNDRSMRVFEPTMIEQVDILVKLVAESHSRPIDMSWKCNYLGMDVVGLLSFGFALNSQTNEEYRFLSDQMAPNNRRLNAVMQVPAIARHRLQVPINMIWAKSRQPVFDLLELMIKKRTVQPADAYHDLWSFIAESMKADEKKDLQARDLWMEAIFFIVAGGDTTATGMAAALFYISRHRDCYDKLAAEIRSAFRSGPEICGSKLTACSYLRACIDETLRMSPPLPGLLWRRLATEEQGEGKPPLKIDGHIVPPGTDVAVGVYALHHNEDYFPDPFIYKPERWLEAADKIEEGAPGSRRAMLDAFAPFSVGARACGGKAMAYLEINLLLAKLLWYFDFRPAPGPRGDVGLSDKGEFHIHDVFVSTNEGPWLVFKPREGSGLDSLGVLGSG
ncbi:cytochrome P450 [Rostrohypoxylon terebratum]|nr:cytochrome P450 [Rostrohypoxylon terebratum]